MPGKNSGGMSMFWLPSKRKHRSHHHHNHNQNHNHNRRQNATHPRQSGTIPMLTEEPGDSSSKHVPEPATLKLVKLRPEPLPGTSCRDDAGDEGHGVEADAGSSDDDPAKRPDKEEPDGHVDDDATDDDDEEPKKGCGYYCVAVIDFCGCTIS